MMQHNLMPLAPWPGAEVPAARVRAVDACNRHCSLRMRLSFALNAALMYPSRLFMCRFHTDRERRT